MDSVEPILSLRGIGKAFYGNRVLADVSFDVAPGEIIGLGSHGNAIGLFMNYVDPAFGLAEATCLRTPEVVKILHHDGKFSWDRSFSAGEIFDGLATDFRATPGVVA